MPSFVRPFVGRTLHKFGGVLGAQVNSDERKLLLRPYVSDRPIKSLRLDLKDSSIQYFELTDLVEIVEANKIKTGDFKKDKASLFWASPARGIFSRASRSQGSRVIQELMKVDQGLANQGKSNLLSTMLEATQNNADNVGIFDIADENFADFSKLLNEWQDLDAELFDATNKAAEAVELDTAPPIWLLSQREIRGEAVVIEADEKSSFDAKELPSSYCQIWCLSCCRFRGRQLKLSSLSPRIA